MAWPSKFLPLSHTDLARSCGRSCNKLYRGTSCSKKQRWFRFRFFRDSNMSAAPREAESKWISTRKWRIPSALNGEKDSWTVSSLIFFCNWHSVLVCLRASEGGNGESVYTASLGWNLIKKKIPLNELLSLHSSFSLSSLYYFSSFCFFPSFLPLFHPSVQGLSVSVSLSFSLAHAHFLLYK